MPIKRYDPKTKATFLKAATDARAAGKSWPEVHAAAKAAGYPGTVKGIIRMLEKASPKSTKSTAPKATAKPIAKPAPAAKRAKATKPVPKAAAAKVPMSRPAVGKRYSPVMKAAIMRAAIVARGKGTWADAHKAAKSAGYRGSVQGIVKMIRASKGKKRGPKAVIKRSPGRPKSAGKRLGRPPMKHVSVNGFVSIQVAVDKIVRERVSAALDRAIAVLQETI